MVAGPSGGALLGGCGGAVLALWRGAQGGFRIKHPRRSLKHHQTPSRGVAARPVCNHGAQGGQLGLKPVVPPSQAWGKDQGSVVLCASVCLQLWQHCTAWRMWWSCCPLEDVMELSPPVWRGSEGRPPMQVAGMAVQACMGR